MEVDVAVTDREPKHLIPLSTREVARPSDQVCVPAVDVLEVTSESLRLRKAFPEL